MAVDTNEDRSELSAVDREALDAYVQKRLREEAEKRSSQTELRLESLRVVGDLLILFVLGLFIVSPFIQLVLRAVKGADVQPLAVSSYYVRFYQRTIYIIHCLARFTAVLVLLWLILCRVVQRRAGKTGEGQSFKRLLGRLLPFFVFLLFDLSIVLATVIRGPNEYDLSGHPYMYESIYSYISYPLVFFFCGMMLKRETQRRFLLYALLFSSLPVNALALVNEWVTKITLFNGSGVCAVFHNSNHYGYYLAITIIPAALLVVYEKKLWLRIFSAFCAVLATVMLIINNTLGAFLAVLFTLLLFLVYNFCIVKKNKKLALFLLGAFLLVTALMSIRYTTVTRSVATLKSDIGKVIADPLESDRAGSGRWKIWKNTVLHMGESPWFGFGVEGLLNTYHVGTPHNELLQYAAFFGIPTCVLYVLACALILLRVLKNCKKLDKTTMICFFACICYLASSFFGVAIYYTTPFIYIFLGLSYAEYLHQK